MTGRGYEPAHISQGYAPEGKGWTCRAYREGRTYEGRGESREAAREACDSSLADDGWLPGPGPRWGAQQHPRPQGEQLEPHELAQVTR